MKKLLLSVVAIATLSSVSLLADNNFGVELGSKAVSTSESKFFGIQSLNEIVGSDNQENYIEGFYKVDNYKLGARYTNISAVDEHKLELVVKANIPSSSIAGLSYNLGVSGGYGEQDSKRMTISTDLTASKYITTADNKLNSHYIDTEIYTTESNYLSFAVQAGVTYKISQNFFINGGIESETKYWNLSYRLVNSGENVYLSGLNQRSMKAYASLEYRF